MERRKMKLEDYVFYGACDKNGASWLYHDKPVKSDCRAEWFGDVPRMLNEENLFPKDKPVKLKLVPVESETDKESLDEDETALMARSY
jgi:hypothetical protein